MKTLSIKNAQLFANRVSATLDEQRNSYIKIKEGKPLDAEEDTSRKLAYIQKQLPVSRKVAGQIADYLPVEMLPLAPEQQRKAESIQGNTVDFMSIAFLDLAKAAAKPIARVIYTDDGDPQGTGFMISPTLFITNNHVIPTAADCQQFLLQFNYEEDYRKVQQQTSEFQLDPVAFFLTAPEDDLDFTIVAISSRVRGRLDRAQLGFLPLFESTDRHIKGMYVNCIQHPSGGTKQLVVRENHLLARTANTLIYGSDTEPGSSGSPVFNDDWEAIGLHHWGEPYRALTDQFENLPKSGNEAIRISSIVKYLKQQQSLAPSMQTLLSDALSISFHWPSHIVGPNNGEAMATLINSVTNQPMGSALEAHVQHSIETTTKDLIKPTQMETNNLSFTVPITISVSLGNVPIATDAKVNRLVEDVGQSSAEKLVPDTDYKSRKGYNPAFLGISVPLPKLSDAQKKKAAPNLWATDSAEFKYQHFSVVMNGDRKLAFFTAVNIDGASVVKIKRETGVVTRGPESVMSEGMEGRENWYDDSRILDEHVCEDTLYTDYNEMKVFQRGHLVKRTDPSWGTEAKAIKGQADTFHFLNCAPQHFKFNPIKTKWAGVEDWITNTSDDENIRVSVFSGPIFTDNDPKGGYIHIPKAFWKIVIWTEEGVLKATAVIADQSKLLQQSGLDVPGTPLGAESLDRLPDNLPAEYHCSVTYLEELTGLIFSNLPEFDTYKASGAESLGGNARLRAFKTYEQLIGNR